jgi:hypothetical protein
MNPKQLRARREQNHAHDHAQNHSQTGDLSRREFFGLAGAASLAIASPHRLPAEAIAPSADWEFSASPLANTHDLFSLPEWGPYSKKHFGISHIPDVRRGLSFDLSLFPVSPGIPARLPSVLSHNSGVHPWEAAPRLEYYSFRLETLWKDQLYCDLSFCEIDRQSRLISMELVNRTAQPRELVVHCLAQLCFPPFRELTVEPIRLCTAELPPGALWISALDYVDLRYATPRPTDNLVADGKWRGEERRHDTVGGSVIAQGFGKEAGDRVHYRVRVPRRFTNAALVWRYSLPSGESAVFHIDGAASSQVIFHGTSDFTTVVVPLGPLEAGFQELHFTSVGGAAPALNGFVLVEAEQAGAIRFPAQPWHPVPAVETLGENALLLHYEDLPNTYGFSLETGVAGHRTLRWRDLDSEFQCQPDSDTQPHIFGSHGHPGDPDSLFLHAWSRPLTLPANSTRLVTGLVCTGSPDEVRRTAGRFDPQASRNRRISRAAQRNTFQPAREGDAAPFDLSQRLMASVTLTNLVYPLYAQGSYIRHYSPGKIWDCLYTWDAGFIGLGLLELDPRCAVEALNTYTTPPGAQSAFIHHGSPLPIQIYLCWELWNRTHSRALLEYFYPRLRQYHLFLAGKLGSSTTRRHQDHLICTWDFFYNTGGWDDYPPQKYVHQAKITSAVAPAVNSSHTIRCAKMLRRMAEALGHTEDLSEYDDDIAVLSSSLQKYSWDESSGYYGYVLHDEEGRPTGIVRTENGVNFNMGLDGVSPLISGICTAAQTAQIVDHLFSPQRMWTDSGITSVDQTAPYYNPDGYWNGSVWFAHQWFLWKTMLDLGRGDLAVRIARTGIAVWKKVTDESYNCMEHFVSHPPFGEGWVQFSSLSSPALSWFAALYTPGRLTCGFDVWTENCRVSMNHRELRSRLRGSGSSPQFSVLACMEPGPHYQVRWNGAPVGFTRVHDGLLQIQLPNDGKTGELEISTE